jgi:hypothetical protein
MKHLTTLSIALTLGLVSGAARAELTIHDEHELNVYRAEETCDIAVQSWIEDYQIPMSAIEGPHGHDGMWEACMRLATPVTVLPAAQHYDTTDGAFWRTDGDSIPLGGY